MALSGYEKQKRWREKHRALYNLQQRNRRKNLRGDAESTVCTGQPERENDRPTVPDVVGEIPTSATTQPFTTKKVGEFRMLVLPEQEKARTEAPATGPIGGVYRNDQGGVISKYAWEKLQRLKKKAEEGGYEIDEYSQ